MENQVTDPVTAPGTFGPACVVVLCIIIGTAVLAVCAR